MTSDQTHIFGHDGHGSVRVLFDMAAVIAQLYSFDAYGQMLGIHDGTAQFVSSNAADALTSSLYSGESFDVNIQQQYLRGRWYAPDTGTFNRLDPFSGNMQDPQSLHKYLYVHGDPVNAADPSGLRSLGGMMSSIRISSALRGMNWSGVFSSAGWLLRMNNRCNNRCHATS
ncbi:MAG: RHS repeat domain-containing protein [Pirellulaceae bacterium]